MKRSELTDFSSNSSRLHQEVSEMRVSTNPQFLIGRPPEKTDSLATGLLGDFQYVNDLSYEWEAAESNALTVTLAVQSAPDTSAVRDFCAAISKLGVAAVMVEEVDEGIQHVTTFLFKRSPELEAEIY